MKKYGIRRIVGHSMMSSLTEGQVVLIKRCRSYKVGDVVVAKVDGREVIKRIVRLDNGDAWIEGDNKPHSTDSRHYGSIQRKAILARVVYPKC